MYSYVLTLMLVTVVPGEVDLEERAKYEKQTVNLLHMIFVDPEPSLEMRLFYARYFFTFIWKYANHPPQKKRPVAWCQPAPNQSLLVVTSGAVACHRCVSRDGGTVLAWPGVPH